MKNKTNTVGIRMDDKTLERLDTLLLKESRSSTVRLLLMYVDDDYGAPGVRADFKRWVRSVANRPSF